MGIRVYRNNTTRKDAAYVVRATLDGTEYKVVGFWGKWIDFSATNYQSLQFKIYYTGTSLSAEFKWRDGQWGLDQFKIYYTGTSLSAARTQTSEMMQTRVSHGYVLVSEYSTPFPWEISASVPTITAPPKPAPQTKPAQSKQSPAKYDPRNPTSAGVLDLD